MNSAAGSPANISDAVKCDLAGDVLRAFGRLTFAATGWSMLPTIFPGDILTVERIDENQVHLGDVILATRDGRLCAHRVIARHDNCGHPTWLTRGDAMAVPDCPVQPRELLGRVAYVTRAGKRITLPLKLNLINRLISILIRRSFFAARVLMYLHKLDLHKLDRRFSGQSHPAKESITPCQG